MDIGRIISKARVEVDDAFELLINEIDLKVERFFADNIASIIPHHKPRHPLFTGINEWREACIKEIRECKDYNLLMIDSETAQLPLDQRIKRFCFLTESFIDTIHNSDSEFEFTLFSTDKYLTKAEITCFETLVKFMPGSDHVLDKSNNGKVPQSICELFVGVEERNSNPSK
jgi:hypothetical protein